MARATRPLSIRRFEGLYYLGLGTGALNAWVLATSTDPQLRHVEPAGVLMDMALITALNLLLLWLIAYRGSNAARWVFTVLVALGALIMLAHISHALDYGELSLALTLAQYLLCAIEILFLFRPDSRDWFAGRRPIDPDIFS
ncbi:MAG: hypothetical protein JO276_12650 [Sphingomonadaceae bacterium]|nr:hypothetical protein [Sphingomonadaceae bacterium]